MAYRIEFSGRAERQFKALSKSVQVRLKKRIDALAENPRPSGAEKLAGVDNLYRIRAGDYRVIDTVKEDVLLVLVVKVGHRREIYRRLQE